MIQTQFTDVYTTLIQHNRHSVLPHIDIKVYVGPTYTHSMYTQTQHTHIHSRSTQLCTTMVNYSAMVACHSQTYAVYWQTHTHNACTNKHTCFMCVYTRTHARNSEICSQDTFCHLHRCTSKDKHLPKCKCSLLAVALFWRRRC